MDKKKLKEIEISNPRYGKFNKTKISLTENLYNRVSKEKARFGGTVLILLQKGRAVRGFKHLITLIKQSDRKK